MDKPTILWVEDKLNEAIAVIEKLRAFGCEVVTVCSRLEACTRLDDGAEYCLIVLDELMEDPEYPANESGKMLFQALREGRWGNWGVTVPVVFATGYAKIVRTLTQDILNPPDEIIDKPITQGNGATRIINVFINHGILNANVPVNSPEIEIDIEIDTAVFDNQAFNDLKQLAIRLINKGSGDYHEAAQHLLGIVATEGKTEETEKHVKSWRAWLSGKGDEFKNGIATAANLVSIAGPALSALGLG